MTDTTYFEGWADITSAYNRPRPTASFVGPKMTIPAMFRPNLEGVDQVKVLWDRKSDTIALVPVDKGGLRISRGKTSGMSMSGIGIRRNLGLSLYDNLHGAPIRVENGVLMVEIGPIRSKTGGAP